MTSPMFSSIFEKLIFGIDSDPIAGLNIKRYTKKGACIEKGKIYTTHSRLEHHNTLACKYTSCPTKPYEKGSMSRLYLLPCILYCSNVYYVLTLLSNTKAKSNITSNFMPSTNI
jgi:hypothetical protein